MDNQVNTLMNSNHIYTNLVRIIHFENAKSITNFRNRSSPFYWLPDL